MTATVADDISRALAATHGDLHGAVEYLSQFRDVNAGRAVRRLAWAWCDHYKRTRRSATRVRLDGKRVVVTRDRGAL